MSKAKETLRAVFGRRELRNMLELSEQEEDILMADFIAEEYEQMPSPTGSEQENRKRRR